MALFIAPPPPDATITAARKLRKEEEGAELLYLSLRCYGAGDKNDSGRRNASDTDKDHLRDVNKIRTE